MALFNDFPIPPEDHPDNRISRSYIVGGHMLPEPKHNKTEAKH